MNLICTTVLSYSLCKVFCRNYVFNKKQDLKLNNFFRQYFHLLVNPKESYKMIVKGSKLLMKCIVMNIKNNQIIIPTKGLVIITLT